MRRIIATLSALAIVGCSSATVPRIAEPQINVRTVDVPRARPDLNRAFFTVVQVEVVNRSASELSLQRIELSSLGVGPFTIVPAQRDFNQAIAPAGGRVFPVWAQATYNAIDETLAQSEGPMVVRGVAFFNSPEGGFRKVFIQRVGTTISDPDGQ
jgi:hypothetical protein